MKMSEMYPEFTALHTHLDKVQREILTRIAELEGLLADPDVPAEAVAKLGEIKGIAQSMDDIVPDAPPPPPEPPPEP